MRSVYLQRGVFRHWFTGGVLGKTGTLATRPGVTWLVPLAPTQPSDARPCPLTLAVTALIWLGMVWRPLAVSPVSGQARFGLEAGDSQWRSRCIRRSLQLHSTHTALGHIQTSHPGKVSIHTCKICSDHYFLGAAPSIGMINVRNHISYHNNK